MDPKHTAVADFTTSAKQLLPLPWDDRKQQPALSREQRLEAFEYRMKRRKNGKTLEFTINLNSNGEVIMGKLTISAKQLSAAIAEVQKQVNNSSSSVVNAMFSKTFVFENCAKGDPIGRAIQIIRPGDACRQHHGGQVCRRLRQVAMPGRDAE